MQTLRDIFAKMPESFDPSAAVGLRAVIRFEITGEGGGEFRVTIQDRRVSVVEAATEAPDLTITASARDYVDIADGTLNEQLAFMTGRISARGDTRLAMKLPKLFPR